MNPLSKFLDFKPLSQFSVTAQTGLESLIPDQNPESKFSSDEFNTSTH